MHPPLLRILRYLRHHVIAITALFVALGGTGYAAFRLPANSVGTQQLRNSAVTPAKLSRHAIGGYVLAWAHVGINGHIWSGSRGAYAFVPPPGTPGAQPATVGWHGVKLRSRCVPIVTPQNMVAGVGQQVNADLSRAGHRTQLLVWTYGAQGQYAHFSFYIAVIC